MSEAKQMTDSKFDYAALDMETRIVVQQKTERIHEQLELTARKVIGIGAELTIVKEKLGHGKFSDWLKVEFDWSERTAQNYMAVHDRFKNANVADLNIPASVLYLLASPSTPEPVVNETVQEVRDGGTVTHKAVKAKVSAAKPQRPAPAVKPRTNIDRFIEDDPYIEDTPSRVVDTDTGEIVQRSTVSNLNMDAFTPPGMSTGFMDEPDEDDGFDSNLNMDEYTPAGSAPTNVESSLDTSTKLELEAFIQKASAVAQPAQDEPTVQTPAQPVETQITPVAAVEIPPVGTAISRPDKPSWQVLLGIIDAAIVELNGIPVKGWEEEGLQRVMRDKLHSARMDAHRFLHPEPKSVIRPFETPANRSRMPEATVPGRPLR